MVGSPSCVFEKSSHGLLAKRFTCNNIHIGIRKNRYESIKKYLFAIITMKERKRIDFVTNVICFLKNGYKTFFFFDVAGKIKFFLSADNFFRKFMI